MSHNNIFKVQTQGSNNKDSPCFKKTQNKNLKLILSRGNAAKPSKKKQEKKFLRAYTEVKQKKLGQLHHYQGPKKEKKRRNLSKITYFNCNKKGHYANNYTKPKN